MDNLKNKLFSVNFGVLSSSILIVLVLKYITRNSLLPMQIINVLSIISLITVFILFTDIFRKNKLFIFLSLVVLMGVSGVYLNAYHEYLKYILILFAGIVLLINLKSLKSFNFHYFSMSFLSSLYFIILIYSSSSQILSPVFLELIINGKVTTDTLFHTSISNSIVFNKVVSTEIHGIAAYKYHWFSHLFYGGLSTWVDMKTIQFYNLIYPAFIIPIFLKYFFILYEKVLSFYNLQIRTSKIFFIAVIIYVTIIFGISGFPAYLSSESLILAHVFQFIFWILVLKYKEKIVTNFGLSFLMFSVIILMLFTKASIGLLTFVIAGYLYLRFSANILHLVKLTFFSVTFVCISYFNFYSIRPEADHLNLVLKLSFFTKNVISFFTYSITIFYILNFFINNANNYTSIKTQFKNKKSILEEIVLLSILISFFFGFLFNGAHGDALYFASTFSLLNLIIISIMFHRWSAMMINDCKLNISIYALFVMCFILSPQFLLIKHNIFVAKNVAKTANPLMRGFLINIMKEEFKKGKIIAVAPNEDWFYNSSKNKKSVLFIIPAISGLPALLPISENDLISNAYSFNSYKETNKEINTVPKLLEQARNLGFKELILFNSVNNTLYRKTIKL